MILVGNQIQAKWQSRLDRNRPAGQTFNIPGADEARSGKITAITTDGYIGTFSGHPRQFLPIADRQRRVSFGALLRKDQAASPVNFSLVCFLGDV